MKQEPQKHRLLMCVAIVLLLAAYFGGYAYSRQQRLSLKHAAARMIFTSQEQADGWLADFHTNHRSMPLDFSDSGFQYILFWPVIKVDSLISGRHSNSPFEILPYAIPHQQENSQDPPTP